MAARLSVLDTWFESGKLHRFDLSTIAVLQAPRQKHGVHPVHHCSCEASRTPSMRRLLLRRRAAPNHSITSGRPIQVVVDVDDTVKSSGNVRILDIPLGGIDAQYERGEFYPGVCDFCFELASARSDPEPVAVLTARAEEFAFALKLDDDDKVVKTFRDCGRRRNVEWGVAPDRVLYGSAHEWVFQDFKGWRKFLNFQILVERFPQSSFVFVGDTGELDGQAGELMCYKYPELMECAVAARRWPDKVPSSYEVNGVPVRSSGHMGGGRHLPPPPRVAR